MSREADSLDSLLRSPEASRLRLGLQSLQRSLYSCFYQSFKNYYQRSRFDRSASEVAFWTLFRVGYTLQLVSLTYPPALAEWTAFKWWVYVVSITKVDFVFVVLGLCSAFYVVTLVLATGPMILFVGVLMAEQNKATVWVERLRQGFVISVRSAYWAFLPALSMAIAIQKYTLSSQTSAPEYLDADTSSLRFPAIGLFSCFFAALLVLWASLHALLNYDPFYTRTNASLSCRAHSKLEVAAVLCHALLVVSHFLLQNSHRDLHLALCAGTGYALAFCNFLYLPFYTRLGNFAAAMEALVLGWTGTAQLVAGMLNSTSSFFIFSIVLPLPACIICWDFLGKRERWVLARYIDRFPELSSPYLAELVIRLLVQKSLAQAKSIPEERHAQVLDLLQRFTGKFKTSQFAVLSEFLYVYSVQDHEGLARLHLSKARHCSFDFESCYNLFRYSSLLNDASKQYYEEVDYVRFRGLYDTAKKADEAACLLELDFWTELSSLTPVVKSVESMGIRLYDAINSARKQSTQLLKHYPQNNLALKLYGTFLMEVYNDTEKGQELLGRGIYQAEHQSSQNGFSYFDDSNGILLVAGSGDNLGCIAYINPQASQILGIPQRLALNMNIANFIPEVVLDAKSHNAALARFLSACRHSEASVPVNLFVLTHQGSLTEVLLQVKCMALEADPFFITVLKTAAFSREVALYDDMLVIREHTQGFAVAVGFSDSYVSMKGCHLVQAFPDFPAWQEKKTAIHRFRLPHTVNEVFVRLLDVRIGNTTVRQLQVTADAEESLDWGAECPLGDFTEQVALTARSPEAYSAAFTSLKGILRKDKVKAKKTLHICFNLNPEVFELGQTDFTPGKHVHGKMKDATPLKKDGKVAKEVNSDPAIPCEILDLKDLTDLSPFGSGSSPDKATDQMSKFSELLSVTGLDAEAKKGGASVASSAVSSNASFTSSNTAQLLLKTVNTAMSRFKIAFILTHIVVIAAVGSMLLYLLLITQRYLTLLDVTDISDQRIVLVDILDSVRGLQLGSVVLNSLSESELQGNLTASVSHMEAIVDSLAGRLSDWSSGRHKDTYMKDIVQVWEMHDSHLTTSSLNLINFLRKVVSEATSLLQKSTLTVSDSSFFFLLQNCFGEPAQAMNSSVQWFIAQEQHSLSTAMDVILILSGTTILLLIVFFLGVICPTVISVEQANQSVWSFFYRLPLDIVQEMCFRCEARLENTHGLEPEQKEEFDKFKNLEDRDKIKCSRKWPSILTRMWLYYVLTLGFFVFFYYEGYLACSEMLRRKPMIENWAGERALAIASAYFWVREAGLDSTSDSYFSVNQVQTVPSADLEAAELLNWLQATDQELLIGDFSHFGLNAASEALLFSNACGNEPALCSETLLPRGLHSGLLSYVLDISSHFRSSSDLRSLQQSKSLLQTVSRSLQSSYDAEIRSQLTQRLALVIGITVLYVVLSAAFYFFLYVPMANGVRRTITHTWELARLIPIDLLERILKSIRSRSDQKRKKPR